MTTSASALRAAASPVAKLLVGKARIDEAVALLSAAAAGGPNDEEGQQVLAEAFRLNPGSPLARMAFERMEGLTGDHATLDAAIAKYTAEEVAKLDKALARPVFRRAQVGFNNNIKYKDSVYHVQTEDSGLDRPHIITHLFADGGRIIKSHKRSYAESIAREDVGAFVRGLMKAQHLEMVVALRDGKFDAVIAGKEIGGMTTLEHPPAVDMRQLSKKKTSEEAGSMRAVPVGEPAQRGPLHFRLNMTRMPKEGPRLLEPRGDDIVIGAKGDIAIDDRFVHFAEGAFHYRDDKLFYEDFDGGNGIYLRIRTPVEIAPGGEFIIGDQLLRVEPNPAPQDGPDPGPTYFYPSPQWLSSFRVVQVYEGGSFGACRLAHGSTMQIGSALGDFVIADDPLVGEQHCVIEEQAGVIVITDLGSETGVFVRVQGEQELVHGDEILLGRTRMTVDLTPSQKKAS